MGHQGLCFQVVISSLLSGDVLSQAKNASHDVKLPDKRRVGRLYWAIGAWAFCLFLWSEFAVPFLFITE